MNLTASTAQEIMAELFTEHNYYLSVLTRCQRNDRNVEDILQDTYLRIGTMNEEKLLGIYKSGGLKWWLVKMLERQVKSDRSESALQYKGRAITDYETGLEAKDNQADDSLNWLEQQMKDDEQNTLAQGLFDSLSELPWFDAELFKYKIKHDHTNKSLANDTGIPRVTIAKTLRRAKRELQFRMKWRGHKPKNEVEPFKEEEDD